ncbi:hypothetical protein ASE14_11340 [Agromyces sp. Root81]|uniref:CU044_5270 family protein n=1 Tax=Agromyces sp. Root81 TaxID=1736601 RepID=UPI0006FEB867|nr:CU044_5270 family protein [Agromyces sp. Root81]KRC61455.1 hypothetical protein ASE14_11340 [Agromyces sp. Root81]
MDELTLLRNAHDEIEPPSDAAMAAAKAALIERIEAESVVGAGAPTAGRSAAGRPPREHPWRRRVGFAGLGTVAAGGVIVALVATNVLGFAGWRGGADAAAAAVLHEASVAAIANSDPVVGPGQYLRIDSSAVYGTTVGGSAGGASASFLTIVEEELYIPADRDDEWVWIRPLSSVYETFGPESEEAARLSMEAVTAGMGADYVERLRAPRGEFYGSPALHDPARLDSLPRDPHRLLNQIYTETAGAGQSPDGEALVWIADTLRTGAVPADLRAAMYEAAAMIPGVTVTEEQANLDGRVGIAIGRLEEADGARQDLIIDPATGQLIGERRVQTRDDGFGFPAGTTTSWTAVTTSVVDAAPEGGTPNGRHDDQGCVKGEQPGSFDCPNKR